jgi:hypothetical protein
MNLKNILAGLEALARNAESEAPPPDPKPNIYEHYKIFREYVEHEDCLINNRLLWNINIQGFLFVTYGYSIQKMAEMTTRHKLELHWLILVLPFVGATIGFLTSMGVKAAQRAIRNLEEQWENLLRDHHSAELQARLYPGLIGGGCPKTRPAVERHENHEWGFRAPIWFSRIFIIAWGILLLASIATLAPTSRC